MRAQVVRELTTLNLARTQTDPSRTRSTVVCTRLPFNPNSHQLTRASVLNALLIAGALGVQLLEDWRMPARRAVLAQAHQAAVLADDRHPQHVPGPPGLLSLLCPIASCC